jgi:hypothetical protein
LYWTALALQLLHLTNSTFPQPGQLNLTVPLRLVACLLHELQKSAMPKGWNSRGFKKICKTLRKMRKL